MLFKFLDEIALAGGVYVYQSDVPWLPAQPIANAQEETKRGPGRRCPDGESGNGDTDSHGIRDTAQHVRESERLARLLSDPNRLATEVLARWHNHHIEATLLRRMHASLRHDPFYAIAPIVSVAGSPTLVELLQSFEDAPVQHRQVRMTIPRGVVGDAYASVLMDELTQEERQALTDTDKLLGPSLQGHGVRRISLSLSYSTPVTVNAGGELVNAQAVLCRGSRPLAYVQEIFYPQPIPLNGFQYKGFHL